MSHLKQVLLVLASVPWIIRFRWCRFHILDHIHLVTPLVRLAGRIQIVCFFSRICQKKNRLRLHAFAFHHYLPPAKRVGMWSPGQGTQLCRLDDAHCSHGVYVVGSLCKQSGSVVSDGCKSAAWSNVWISPLVTNLVCDDRYSVCTHVLRYSIECLNHSKWSRKSTSVKNVSHYRLFKVFEYKFDLISYSNILIIKYESIKVLC